MSARPLWAYPGGDYCRSVGDRQRKYLGDLCARWRVSRPTEHEYRVGVDTDCVHQALRYYLAERLDDMPPEDMLKQMYAATGRDRVDTACADLTRDPSLLESGLLLPKQLRPVA